MVGRIVRSTEFERVLALAPTSRSAHFAAHHLAADPLPPRRAGSKSGNHKLSTWTSPVCPPPVDDLPPTGWWLGSVVPKRNAKRAVTRNLIKREMRTVMNAMVPRLPQGLWVLRLRSPFDSARYRSAASEALRAAAADELRGLLARCLKPSQAGSTGSARA